MTLHRHPRARAEARHLVDQHDGHAEELVAQSLEQRLADRDVEEALHLDQVRREIDRIYTVEGK